MQFWKPLNITLFVILCQIPKSALELRLFKNTLSRFYNQIPLFVTWRLYLAINHQNLILCGFIQVFNLYKGNLQIVTHLIVRHAITGLSIFDANLAKSACLEDRPLQRSDDLNFCRPCFCDKKALQMQNLTKIRHQVPE